MTKRSNKKQQFKTFPINNVTDGLTVLGSLISHVTMNLNKYRGYHIECNSLLQKYASTDPNQNSEILIPASEYDNINDKLLYRQREILKFVADYQDSSFSYISLRKILLKKGYLKDDLPTDIQQLLNDLLDTRNWSFHNAQSVLVASKETFEKNIPDYLKQYLEVQPQLNPVLIPQATFYELSVLYSLAIHSAKRIQCFETVLERMKLDYEFMYSTTSLPRVTFYNGKFTSEILYINHPQIIRFMDSQFDIAQISMAIQKSKYDGSEESFNQWTHKQNDKKEL